MQTTDHAITAHDKGPRRTGRTLVLGWVAGLALLAWLYVLATRTAGHGSGLTLPWVVAPYVAAASWAIAAGGTTGRVRAAFMAIAMSGLIGVMAQFAWAVGVGPAVAGHVAPAAYLYLLPYAFLAVGVSLSLGSRREWTPEVTIDAALLLLAGAAATSRLVLEPLRFDGGYEPGVLFLIAGLQLVVMVPAYVAAVLVLRRGSALAPASAAALMGSTLAFAAGAMFALTDGGMPTFEPPDAAAYLWLGGWLLLAFSGYAVRDVPATSAAMLVRRRAHDGIRRRIVPIAALVLTVAAVDLALRPPVHFETVLAVAALGLALTLRTGYVFSMADREAEQRRQLAHTRALVRVTHALAGTTDLDETLEVISRSACTVLGTRGAGIELISDDGSVLETRAVVGLPEGLLGTRFPVEGSFTGWVVRHGQPRATTDPSADPYIQPQGRELLGRSPFAAAPIRFRGETLGALFACVRSEPFDAEELDLLGALAEQASIAIENARLFDQVRLLSMTDPLTGLANRRQLDRDLQRDFAAARRGRPLVAVIFDLDRFKEYNDTHGHLAGDEVLISFADALRAESRAMNLAARYGGDEFVALLSDAGPEGAETFLERVRLRFAGGMAALGRGPVSVSAGVAAYHPGMRSPQALLRAADAALYREKPRVRT